MLINLGLSPICYHPSIPWSSCYCLLSSSSYCHVVLTLAACSKACAILAVPGGTSHGVGTTQAEDDLLASSHHRGCRGGHRHGKCGITILAHSLLPRSAMDDVNEDIGQIVGNMLLKRFAVVTESVIGYLLQPFII